MEESPISNGKFTGGKTPPPLINERIRTREVLLIDDEGVNHGAILTATALEMAYEKNLDLVVVSPNQDPPVAKILDYGKYKFETEKKAKEAKKKQHTVEVKELKMRYSIDIHDYNVRMKSLKNFISDGNKVKIVIMLKGREIQHSSLAFALAKRIKDELPLDECIIEKHPSMEGKNVIMIIGPVTKS